MTDFSLDDLPRVDIRRLPNTPVVYFVLDHSLTVLYVGRTKSLAGRWKGKHHRKADIENAGGVTLAWLATEVEALAEVEAAAIAKFDPPLNRTLRPSAYLPRVPDESIISAEEAAKILGKTRRRINQLLVEGKLKGERIGNSNVILRTSVTEFSKRGSAQPLNA